MESRQNILAKIENMFFRYGIKSVTMDDISRHLGISKKTLYQFVENKKDLIQQVFQKVIVEEKQAMRQIVTESKDAIEEIVAIAEYVTQQLRQVSPQTLYDLQKYYRKSWQMMEALHSQHTLGIIKANINRGISEGVYRQDINADIIAKLYVGKNSLLVDEDLFPLKEYSTEQLFLQHIRYHIYGIASKDGLKLLEKYTNK